MANPSEEDNTEDYSTRDGKDIPFDEKKMRLNDVLSTDYQVTDEELADYEAAEASGNGLSLKLKEFEEYKTRREMQEQLVKEEIRERAIIAGLSSHEATKQFKLFKVNNVRETIRKMMALYEAHRRYLYNISKGQRPAVGVENEEVRYYTKFLHLYRLGIQDMQKELKSREDELRTAFNTDTNT